ncbi:MAG TPA: hypothetical protein VFJ98_04935 [Mycobacteriales bacterium]|nr:hypothetical protein [Mycobacteriales bacterium]
MRKMVRLSLVAGATAAVIGGAMLATPSMAAPGGGECELSGTANFHPGPAADPAGTINYDFAGDLTNCGDSTTGPTGFGTITGKITAGQVITIGGVQYQEPAATGTGSCAEGDTAGTAIVQWSDGSTSVIGYTTKSVLAGVALQGNVLASTVLKAVDPSQPDLTVTSTKYQGAGAAGVLAFEVTDPTQCTAGGVTSAGIDGFTGLGTTS